MGFDERGQIKIQTKGKTQTVNPDALLYSDYRYVDTVHSSQGKTANHCIYAAGSGKSLTVVMFMKQLDLKLWQQL
ncbi:hypothetical protein [Pleurocapsa sp. PCC 7319]|uniref:hypothetical protein n=1 Tax=Pleurocapsa sp. PCC 7319 TaxID=118161 RepID=UPI000346C3C0|nr:hypothetical protein [Pleurocapsa sp. PCC 7319]